MFAPWLQLAPHIPLPHTRPGKGSNRRRSPAILSQLRSRRHWLCLRITSMDVPLRRSCQGSRVTTFQCSGNLMRLWGGARFWRHCRWGRLCSRLHMMTRRVCFANYSMWFCDPRHLQDHVWGIYAEEVGMTRKCSSLSCAVSASRPNMFGFAPTSHPPLSSCYDSMNDYITCVCVCDRIRRLTGNNIY